MFIIRFSNTFKIYIKIKNLQPIVKFFIIVLRIMSFSVYQKHILILFTFLHIFPSKT